MLIGFAVGTLLLGVEAFHISPKLITAKHKLAVSTSTTASFSFESVKTLIKNAFGGNNNSVSDADALEKEKQLKNQELLSECDRKISYNKDILLQASTRSYDDTNQIVKSLEDLEKLMRERNKLDDGLTSTQTLSNLNGTWRLIFTTGTVSTQKKIGKINYFPLKAEQSFNTTDFTITNGIYLGDFAALKFFGSFEWKLKPRKLEFDFDAIQVLGLKIGLPSGKAADLGKATGLGSDNNAQLVKRGVKPFFNWISADENIATARGGGGGLALWRRVA